MELTLRPATPTERLYAKRQCIPIMERCGSPGILVAELDDSGTAFCSHWDIWDPAWKTPEFSVELDAMIEMLRSDQRYGPVLKNIPAMIAYCLNNQESRIIQSPEYLFRVDAGYHAYLLRCTPSEMLDNAYIYAYRRDLLERHMKEAEKGIRFVTTDGKEKFRVSDGEQIRIITGGDGTRDRTARYIDAGHMELSHEWGSTVYSIREFAERLEQTGGMVIPMRSTLPDKCYAVLPSSDEIIIVKKGESGYYRTDKYGHDRAEALEVASECNERGGVTKAQTAAMLAGSLFGWEVPAADPKNYDEQGQPIKPKRHDRGNAR